MYFIEDGTVSIRIEQESGEVEISVLGKGQYFGELALVTHRPRAASAYASTDNVKVACKYTFDHNFLIILLKRSFHLFLFLFRFFFGFRRLSFRLLLSDFFSTYLDNFRLLFFLIQ